MRLRFPQHTCYQINLPEIQVIAMQEPAAEPFEGPLPDCPSKPNCVCTQASQPDRRGPALHFDSTPETAIAWVVECLQARPRTKLVEQRSNYLHYTFTTALFRFVDDVEFWADGATGSLHYRSASRLGYSDLGANGKRMREICQVLVASGNFRNA